MKRTLDYQSWQKAKSVLLVEDLEKGTSVRAAAEAAGLTPTEFKAYIVRSRRRDPVDEPWVHEIAPLVDAQAEREELIGQTLRDVALQRAIYGVPEPVYYQGAVVGHKAKYDTRLLLRLLERYDPTFKHGSDGKDDGQKRQLTVKELYERVQNLKSWEDATQTDGGAPVVNGKKMDA